MCRMRYSILTPTILRESLLKACESVNMQTSKDWEHLVMVDSELSTDLLVKIQHPHRKIIRCPHPHRDYGHGCTHFAWTLARGEYCYRLDDDNELADENVLKDLEQVTEDWAIFPILRYGQRFFHDPPGNMKTDSGSFMVKRGSARWPNNSAYNADGLFVEELVKKFKYRALGDMRPLMVMAASNEGRLLPTVATAIGKLTVSIFTPAHNNSYLAEAYESLKAQTDPDWQWTIVFNNGGVPTDFGDSRVKSQVLYQAPGKVGTLKAYACSLCTGDILLELDCDDMLAPTAIAEVKKAFADPDVSFAYSNAMHAMADLSKFPRFDEAFGWKYREVEFQGKKLDEFISFPPTPESVSRIWYAPDHFRAFRRSVYQEVGGHDKSRKILDDGELMCRMYLETKFKHIDRPLYVYRVHGENSWLKHNDEIQQGVWPLYDQYIERLVRKWAEREKLPVVEVTTMQDLYSQKTSSVGMLRATDSFASFRDPLETMREVYRVLVPGGWLFCQVPSTDGRGAYQDPRHQSFWNENSFKYYVHRDWAKFIGTPVRFQATRLYTTEKNADQVCWTIAHLVSLKDGYRPAGLVEI